MTPTDNCCPLWCAALFAALTACPPALAAQANVNVPPDDPAYEYLDNLIAFGLVTSDISGTKPYSRGEFSRLIIEAKQRYDGDRGTYDYPLARSSLDYLSSRFADDVAQVSGTPSSQLVHLRLVDDLQVSYFNYKGEHRALGTPQIDAQLQPFIAYREGRKFQEGQNIAVESRHWIALGKTAGLYYHGRLIGTAPRSSSGFNDDVDFETMRFYFKATKWNIDLLVGKDGMQWGMGQRGNLMLSTNAKPVGTFKTLPLIKLSNTKPVRLPWILNGLGPMRYTLFVSRLEENRSDFPRQFFIGSRLNFKTGKNSEFGLSHSYLLGGEGFPTSFSFFDALAEFFGIRTKQNFFLKFRTGEKGENIANHFMGFDFKLRFPALRYTEFYNEFYFDDLFNPSRLFSEQLGYHGGLYVPRLTPNGSFGGRIEVTHTSNIFYTVERRVLGSDLGPLGNELHTEIQYKPDGNTVWSGFANAQFRGLGDGKNRRVAGVPDEKRYRLGGTFSRRLRSNVMVRLEASYMRTADFDDVAGDDRDEFFFGLTVRVMGLGKM
ncbi:MAG: capsule assembly Wzi family protein [Gemmatimonadales bacterium]